MKSNWWKFWRRPKTRNEIKQNNDPEIKEFVRAKRNKNNMVTAWDDNPISQSRSWKDNTKKRHSWEK